MNDISPITVVDTNDLTQAVREAAMLADVSLSMWEASQNDRHLMDGVKKAHGARGDAGKVIKFLMNGADSRLKSTRAAFKAVQARHKELTLPWVSNPNATRVEGPRLLPHLLFQQYNSEISGLINAAYAELNEFIYEYPDLVIQAKANMGTMVDDSSYPTPEQVRAKFNIEYDFQPIPAGSGFGGLPGVTLERLNKRLETRQARMAQEAQAEMWQRLRAPLEHLVERLTVEDDEVKIFKTATIENVKDILTMLPGWNVTGDPRVKEITDQLDGLVDTLDPDALRASPRLRREAAAESRRVVDKLTRWGL